MCCVTMLLIFIACTNKKNQKVYPDAGQNTQPAEQQSGSVRFPTIISDLLR